MAITDIKHELYRLIAIVIKFVNCLLQKRKHLSEVRAFQKLKRDSSSEDNENKKSLLSDNFRLNQLIEVDDEIELNFLRHSGARPESL